MRASEPAIVQALALAVQVVRAEVALGVMVASVAVRAEVDRVGEGLVPRVSGKS